MKHPEGLPCQVFISHAWAEGIFELANLLRQAWPRGHGLHNLCYGRNGEKNNGTRAELAEMAAENRLLSTEQQI